jgi:hypothetical protein
VAAKHSFHSLLDYECFLFHCDWLGSDLRVGHFFSFRCPLVNTPQLNSQLSYEWIRLTPCLWLMNELVDDSSTTESINYVSSFYNSGRTDERLLPLTVRVLVCFIRCHGNVLTEPLSSNRLFRVYSLLWNAILACRCLAMDYSVTIFCWNLFTCMRRVFFVSTNSLKMFTRTVLSLCYMSATLHLYFLKSKCRKELPGENLLRLAVEERPLSMLSFYKSLSLAFCFKSQVNNIIYGIYFTCKIMCLNHVMYF